MSRPRSRIARIVGFTLATLLLFAATASAAPRFAAPGGDPTSPSTCADPGHPCALFVAVGEGRGANPGDEVILAPGTYSDRDGDLGSHGTTTVLTGLDVHGPAGSPRPVISFEQNVIQPGFIVGFGSTLRHVRINNFSATVPFAMSGGTVEDVLVRSNVSRQGAFACSITGGIFRDSACIASGAGASAIGCGVTLIGSGVRNVTLRNVTAVATGFESSGLQYTVFGSPGFGEPTVAIDAKSVIAFGNEDDVAATVAFRGTVSIAFDHSAYQTVSTTVGPEGLAADVTPAGSGTNIEAEPHLATDGLHELLDSPTVNTGVIDASSGATDIDGEPRQIGGAPDIGADEFNFSATHTAVSCAPKGIELGEPTVCTATVDTSGFSPPRGAVEFFSDSVGAFNERGRCDLTAVSNVLARCHLIYIPGLVGSGIHTIGAEYLGDAAHGESESFTTVNVALPAEGPAGGPPQDGGEAPDTRLRRQTKRRAGRVVGLSFFFVSDQPDASFECSLDRRSFRRCASPFRVRTRSGAHRFEVRAVTSKGISDQTPASYRWRVPRRR